MESMVLFQRALRSLVVILLTMAAGFSQWQNAPLQAPAHPNMRLYHEDANAEQDISKATARSRKENKRVLLVFGGNWCIDCHVLDDAFHRPRIAPLLDRGFIVVHVDVGQYTRNLNLAKKYRVNLEKGVPAMAVLNSRGGFLYSTSEFEKARLKTEDDLAGFLNAWMPVAATKP